MRMIGLFTLHQKQQQVLELLKQYGQLYVHSRGKVIYKIVPLKDAIVVEESLLGADEDEKIKSTVEAKLHGLTGGNCPG